MTNAELAILSLVAEKERHGYEMEQVIVERGMRDWTDIGFSSIYFLLKKLEREGLVEAHLEAAAGRGPSRKVFRLTGAGRAAWQDGVLRALSEPEQGARFFQLGLACLPGLPAGEALKAVRRYKAALEERLGYVQERAGRLGPLPAHVEAMFGHSLALIRAELDWIGNFITTLEVPDDEA